MTSIQSVTVNKLDNTANTTTNVRSVSKVQRVFTRIARALMTKWCSVIIEMHVNCVLKVARARYQNAFATMEQVCNSISKRNKLFEWYINFWPMNLFLKNTTHMEIIVNSAHMEPRAITQTVFVPMEVISKECNANIVHGAQMAPTQIASVKMVKRL